MIDAPIKSIFGEQPRREEDSQTSYMVGQKVNFWREPGSPGPKNPNETPAMETVEITKIELRVENRGDHGVGWYDVWAGDALISSLNERHVAEVYRDLPTQVAP